MSFLPIVASGFVVIVTTALVSLSAWVVNTNSRVSVQETKVLGLDNLVDERIDSVINLLHVHNENVGDKFDAIGARLSRIERALNGSWSKLDS